MKLLHVINPAVVDDPIQRKFWEATQNNFLELFRTLKNVVEPVNNPATIPLPGGGGVTDHGALSGLLDDDHTQYLLLAGRVGGQVVYGSPTALEALRLFGSSSSPQGHVDVNPTLAQGLLTVTPDTTYSGGTGLLLLLTGKHTGAAATNYIQCKNNSGTDEFVVKNSRVDFFNGAAYVDSSGNADLASLILDTPLVIAEGGTGASTVLDARINLLPTYTTNQLKVLRVNSGETDVEWATDVGALTVREDTGLVGNNVTTLDFGNGIDCLLFGQEVDVDLDLAEYTGTFLQIIGGGTGAGTTLGARQNILPSMVGNQDKYLRVNPGATDAMWSPVASGGGFVTQVLIDFGATPVESAVFTITDTNMTTGKNVLASVAYKAPTGKDLDEIEMDTLFIACGSGSGQFDMFIRSCDGSYLADKFFINYTYADPGV